MQLLLIVISSINRPIQGHNVLSHPIRPLGKFGTDAFRAASDPEPGSVPAHRNPFRHAPVEARKTPVAPGPEKLRNAARKIGHGPVPFSKRAARAISETELLWQAEVEIGLHFQEEGAQGVVGGVEVGEGRRQGPGFRGDGQGRVRGPLVFGGAVVVGRDPFDG